MAAPQTRKLPGDFLWGFATGEHIYPHLLRIRGSKWSVLPVVRVPGPKAETVLIRLFFSEFSGRGLCCNRRTWKIDLGRLRKTPWKDIGRARWRCSHRLVQVVEAGLGVAGEIWCQIVSLFHLLVARYSFGRP